MRKQTYTAKDITVLEGLEAVRKRPSMYIGSTSSKGLHHLVHEVVDNSIDEALAGFATDIKVAINKDNSVSVKDNGRGIPVGKHEKYNKSALEIVLTKLHAGGKFGGRGYKVSGGLHGIGLSVVNALSENLQAQVYRDGQVHVQEYERGKPKGPVAKKGKTEKTGTLITFKPDSKVFPETEFKVEAITHRLKELAYLNKGLKIQLKDERTSPPEEKVYRFPGGIMDFVKQINEGKDVLHKKIIYFDDKADETEVEAAMQWNAGYNEATFAFANNINTHEGGTHLVGFKNALTRVVNDYAKGKGLLKASEENLSGEDIREGLTAIISVKLLEPQFEGQTKTKLGNQEIRPLVDAIVSEQLKIFLEENPNQARKIITKAIQAARARAAARKTRELTRRKSLLESTSLPGKLADCQTKEPSEAEIYIVEGDSAGGCFSGDTKVALVDGRELSFKELVEEYEKGKTNYCYSIGKDGKIGIQKISNPRKTKINAEVIKVILDNGEEIKCTPDHKFMLRDGSYKKALDLKESDSLMPLRRQYSKLGKRITIKGYELVFDPRDARWIFTHLLADQHNLETGVYSENDGSHRHHIDFNKLSNNPNNIIRMNDEEHAQLHRDRAELTLHTEETKQKCREVRTSPEYRKKLSRIMSAPKMKKMLSERAKKQWQNEEYREYMASKFLEFYHTNADYRLKNKARLLRAQREHWSHKENIKKQSNRVRKYFELHPEKIKVLRKAALKQWQDPKLLSWRSRKTKEQWTDGFRSKRKKAYDRTYPRKALQAMYELHQEGKEVNKETYDEIREIKNDKSLIRYETICQRFFESNEELLKDAAINFNHRIKAVMRLKEKIDVYDLEAPNTHNFALASGVFVHNSAKQARDRSFQAILPLRGKILNVEKSRLNKVLSNNEIQAMITAMGTGIDEDFNLESARYHRIVLMTDADVDGSHIRTLILTFLYRYMQPMIEAGYVYIAQPPLYKIQKGKEVSYAYTEKELEDKLKEHGRNGVQLQRYKGLGEMTPTQLWDTTMDPEKRTLLQVSMEDAVLADEIFTTLMGDKVDARREFIQTHAKDVRFLDI